ncbi:DUF1648 domain-containing protein [Gordonia iterans]
MSPNEPPSPNEPSPTTLTDDEIARRRPVIAFVTVAVVIPVLLIGIATAVQISLLGALPADVAVHWNLAGEPDRWMPAWSLPLITAILGLAVIALIAGPTVRPVAQGDSGAVYRILGGTALGVSVLLAVVFTGAAWYQIDGGTVPITTIVAVASLAAAAVGTVGGLLLPQPPRAERTAAATPMPLGDDEQAVWLRTTTASPGVLAISAAGFAMALLATVFSWADGQSSGFVIGALVVTVVIGLASVVTVAFRVRVSGEGLEVLPLAGFPRLRVPLDDVVDVRVDADVRPIGDFGGYGIRKIGRRTGVVPRRGEGILVERTGDRVFGVVVDDAATGAALLAALADRAKEGDQ